MGDIWMVTGWYKIPIIGPRESHYYKYTAPPHLVPGQPPLIVCHSALSVQTERTLRVHRWFNWDIFVLSSSILHQQETVVCGSSYLFHHKIHHEFYNISSRSTNQRSSSFQLQWAHSASINLIGNSTLWISRQLSCDISRRFISKIKDGD